MGCKSCEEAKKKKLSYNSTTTDVARKATQLLWQERETVWNSTTPEQMIQRSNSNALIIASLLDTEKREIALDALVILDAREALRNYLLANEIKASHLAYSSTLATKIREFWQTN